MFKTSVMIIFRSKNSGRNNVRPAVRQIFLIPKLDAPCKISITSVLRLLHLRRIGRNIIKKLAEKAKRKERVCVLKRERVRERECVRESECGSIGFEHHYFFNTLVRANVAIGTNHIFSLPRWRRNDLLLPHHIITLFRARALSQWDGLS